MVILNPYNIVTKKPGTNSNVLIQEIRSNTSCTLHSLNQTFENMKICFIDFYKKICHCLGMIIIIQKLKHLVGERVMLCEV
jgi:hypothetical protein